jgi:peroxiredoxin
MSLQDKLDAYKAEWESGKPPYNVPASVVETVHRATDEMIASGQADRALKAGAQAPTFLLPDADGNPISSEALLKKGPLVITFYRGVWCPYCNMDLQAIQAALAELQAAGGQVVAMSPQLAPNSRRSQRDNKLTFPILIDKGAEVANAFGIRVVLPGYLQDLYRSFKTDLAVINGDPSWSVPMPARYIIDRAGMIAYAEVNPDYTRRPDPTELLPTLNRLRQTYAVT